MSPFVRPSSSGLTSMLLSEHLFCIICIYPSTPLSKFLPIAVSSWDCTWKWYYKDGTKPNNQSGGYPSYVWIILSPHPDQVCVFHVLLSETPLCACLSVGQLVSWFFGLSVLNSLKITLLLSEHLGRQRIQFKHHVARSHKMWRENHPSASRTAAGRSMGFVSRLASSIAIIAAVL